MTDPAGEVRGGLGVAVAAPNDLAAHAGVAVALDGGNAVDAAVAAAVTTMVTEPGLVSLTAGGYVTVLPADGEPVTVDGGVEMPGRGLPDDVFGRAVWDVRTPYAGGTTMTIGPGSVATPGALKALDVAWRRWGALPWRRLLEPAVEAAAGFPHGSASHYYLSWVHEQVFGWDPEGRRGVYGADGAVVPVGGQVVIPDLAETVGTLAEEGADALYDGGLARAVADAVVAAGGLLTRADLAAYEAVVREPLLVETGGWLLATNPPPAAGGTVLAGLLRRLEGLPEAQTWSARELRMLALAQADLLAVSPSTSPSTATVAAVDANGGACAVTVSSGYGSGFSVPGTGLAMNNCLGEQELLPAGAHSLPTGTRLNSNMAPTVGRRVLDGAALAVGSPGSDRIPTALAQVLALFVTGGLDIHAAIAHPRLHVRIRPAEDPPALVDHEEDLPVPGDTGLPLRAMPSHSMYFGGVNAALWTPSLGLQASGDPRRAGAVAVHSG